MSQEQEHIEQTSEQNTADFMAGFNAVRNSDAEAPEMQAVEAEKKEDEPVTAEEQTTDATEAAAEEQTFFGMTESQIKSLLERSAKVDSIEDQLRRANGKIGELNGTLQQLAAQRQPTQHAPAPPLEDEELKRWAEDFPEVSAIAEARARQIASEMMQGMQQQAPAFDKNEMIRETNIAILDATQDGWRETINSQDFALWIATQPADVQEAYATTNSAKVLGGVLNSFNGWKAKTEDRGAKSKARLESALLPSGGTAKVSHAPTANDEFLAGFNAVRSQYR